VNPERELAPVSPLSQRGGVLWAATLIWVVGMVTVFPIGNRALEAVSVFTYDRIAYLIVAALLAVAVVRNPAILRQFDRMELAIALYLAIVVTSWLTTLSDKHVVELKQDVDLLVLCFLMPFAAFVIGRHCGWTSAQIRTACWVIVIAACTYLIVLGLVQAFVDWRFLVAVADQDMHRRRARGSFPNAVPYAAFLSLLVLLALTLHAYEPQRRRRVLLLALCVGLVEALVLSRVRITWVALPIALLYLAAVDPPARRSAVAVSAALFATIALAFAGLDLHQLALPNGALAQPAAGVAERIADSEPMYNRVAVYATALNMIVHRPLLGFGVGARTFMDSRAPYYASCCGVSWEWAVPCAVPHNEVLNLLVLMGVVGLLAYLLLVSKLWRLLAARRRACPGTPRASLAACAQASFIVLAITAQLHDVMYFFSVQVLFFLVAGLVTQATAPAGGSL
jgi:O-antigen ligase